MDRGKKLIKNTIVLMFGSILTKGLNFIMAPLFTRWLTTTEYGTFDLIATYSTLLIPILAIGTHHAVFRFLLDVEESEDYQTVLTNTVFLNIVGVLLYLLCLIIICFVKPSVTEYGFLLTVLLLTQTMQNYMGMYIRGIKKLKLYSIVNIVCTASILLCVFVFVRVLGMGLQGMILGYSLGYVISTLTSCIASQNYKHFKIVRVDIHKMKDMLRYSVPMIPNSISWWIVTISDRVIVSMVLGVAANATVAIAHKIPNLCTTIYDIFQTAWVENAAEAISDKDWDSYFSKMLNIMGQFCISVSILIVTTNFFLYDWLFTTNYREGKYLVPLFSLAIIFASLSQTLGSVFIAEYDSKVQGTTMLGAGLINIIINIILIKFVGIYASAISTVIAYAFLLGIRYKIICKKYAIHIENKTKKLALLMLLFVIISYIEMDVVNFVCLVTSFIIVTLYSKDTIGIILRRIIKNN